MCNTIVCASLVAPGMSFLVSSKIQKPHKQGHLKPRGSPTAAESDRWPYLGLIRPPPHQLVTVVAFRGATCTGLKSWGGGTRCLLRALQ